MKDLSKPEQVELNKYVTKTFDKLYARKSSQKDHLVITEIRSLINAF